MGEVVDLVTDARVDEAWRQYAEEARRLAADPMLLFDRAFNEELTRRHERWRKLFLRWDARR